MFYEHSRNPISSESSWRAASSRDHTPVSLRLPCQSAYPGLYFLLPRAAEPEEHSSPVFSYKRIDKWAPEVPRGGGGVPLKTKVFIPGHVLIKLHTPTPWTSRASHCERHRHFNQMAQIGCLLWRCLSALLIWDWEAFAPSHSHGLYEEGFPRRFWEGQWLGQ